MEKESDVSLNMDRNPWEEPEPLTGLSMQEVLQRVQAGQVNTPVNPDTVTLGQIVRSNVCTYFNLIFLIMAVCLVAVGSLRSLTFLPLIFANTAIGIFQQWRAKRALEKLQIIHAPKTHVLRDGEETEIASEEIVLGDVMIFRAGSPVPADALILQGEAAVDESLLTGEADEIMRQTGDRLLSGSHVVSGMCYARAEKVGADSYISQLTLEAGAHRQGEESEMIRSLDRLVKIVGILIIPMAVMLLYQHYVVNDNTVRESVVSTVAAILGMIPEGLYLLASVAMAVSAMRLAWNKVLVHDMKSIETLARVDVLCVDKTGTITENEMRVHEVIPLRHELSRLAQDVSPSEIAEETGESSDEQALAMFASVMSEDNATMKALKTYCGAKVQVQAEKVVPFSSSYKYSSARIDGINYVLGAPAFVLGGDFAAFAGVIEQHEHRGYRVLLFGICDHEPEAGPFTGRVEPLCLVLLSNPVRPAAAETFRRFAEQGVEVKVISGDSPAAASAAAMQAQIPGAERMIDVSAVSDADLAQAAQDYTVFGRVTPARKRQLVRALKEAGHTVAMTGDGVNDVLALREADCSVAMASGVQAASQSAQMVLLESDFARMHDVVLEGRRVVNNIERTASLFLVKNIFSFLMALTALILRMNYPIEPSQLSLVSMFTIGVPAFFLSLETNGARITGHFLSNVLYRALPAGITDFVMVSVLVFFAEEIGLDDARVSTCAVLLLAVIGMMVLWHVIQPLTVFHAVLWLAMAAGLVICIAVSPLLQQLYGISQLSHTALLMSAVFILAGESVLRCLRLVFGQVRRLFALSSKLCYNAKRKRESMRKSFHDKIITRYRR